MSFFISYSHFFSNVLQLVYIGINIPLIILIWMAIGTFHVPIASLQRIQWASYILHGRNAYLCIYHCSFGTGMTQQFLYVSYVGSSLYQVRGKTVPQATWIHLFMNPPTYRGPVQKPAHAAGRVHIPFSALKEIVCRSCISIINAQVA